jgi:phage shock protein PspC (stress-responsive transcriptional regulator)
LKIIISSKAYKKSLRFANLPLYNILNMKRLTKSYKSVKVSGILGGVGEWMEVSPWLLRAGYVVIALFTGIIPAIALYFILHFLIPHQGSR